MRGLKGKIAIVTGASSPIGMGRAAALRLAQEGVDVVVTDITPNEQAREALNKVVTEIETLGVRSLGITVDVTDETQIERCVEQTVAELGGVDILFNNAGFGKESSCEESSLEFYDLMWRINARGVIAFTKAVIGSMKARGGGSIINNSSLAGMYGEVGLSAYNASKFAVIGFTKSVALELGPYNIRVNAIMPGAIDTAMARQRIEYMAKQQGVSPEEVLQQNTAGIALRRFGRPEEIADVVAWLASDEASYVTGVSLPVAGGSPPALA